MKILLLPNNIASRMNQNVAVLRALGHDARGILISPLRNTTSGGNIEVYRALSHTDFSFKAFFSTIPTFLKVFAAIYRADVIHWYFGSSSKVTLPFLWWIKFLKRPAIVEFCGTDIRTSEGAAKDNPFLEKIDHRAVFKSVGKSEDVQNRFAKNGFKAMTFGYELESYINKEIFPYVYKTNRCINLKKIKPHYSANIKTPVIAHIPSKSSLKGTSYILHAVQLLRDKGLAFEFQLVENVSHSEVFDVFAQSDIVIDQMLVGDHGTTTLEAMALGKMVVCYIKPSIIKKMPNNCPIVNANINNLAKVLESYILNPDKIVQKGVQSRKYVEKHHSAEQVVKDLVGIYEELAAGDRQF